MKKIVLLTTGQPSTNPRLVKEAIAFFNAGYQVTVIYSFWVSWADKVDAILINQYPGIEWIRVGGHPQQQKVNYWLTRVRHKIYQCIATIFPTSVYWQQRAVVRCHTGLTKKALSKKANIYIAHNLGALPAVAKAAKNNNIRYAFDAEDYHRGETIEGSKENRRAIILEDAYLPGVAYCTAASPLIAEEYHKHYPSLQPIVINNVFSEKYLQPVSQHNSEVLKLFWFSQTIGPNRGLETVINAINKVYETYKIELHLLGQVSGAFKIYLQGLATSPSIIHFIEPVTLDEIFSIASKCDIGLAVEVPHNINRDLCLTNKLFIYLLAGNFIIATDTSAQKLFFDNHPAVGCLFKNGDSKELAAIFLNLCSNKQFIEKGRHNSYQLARDYMNWEKEEQLLLSVVENSVS